MEELQLLIFYIVLKLDLYKLIFPNSSKIVQELAVSPVILNKNKVCVSNQCPN